MKVTLKVSTLQVFNFQLNQFNVWDIPSKAFKLYDFDSVAIFFNSKYIGCYLLSACFNVSSKCDFRLQRKKIYLKTM